MNMNLINQKIRRGRPATRNREHVLETAMNAYWQDNLAATSVNAICVLAGVSKPSLYRDFGSEDGLTVAVLHHYSSKVLVQLGDILMADASYTSKVDKLIQFASKDPLMENGCLFIKMRAGRSRFGVQTQAKIDQIETQALSLYIRFFKDSYERKEWSAKVSPELAGRYLMEQLGLAISQRAEGKNKETVRELLTLSLSALNRT
jgi:TetR/AcrR family transcriptional regulator, copper-responsive repressor